MNQETSRDHISKRRVVYTMPGVDAVTVRRDEEYRTTDAEALTMDLYYPPGHKRGARLPAVVFVTGFPDAGAKRMLGCALKEMGSYVSWAQLAAVSGLVAITYTNRDPAADARAMLQYVKEHAASVDVDEHRIGVWACSGNVPTALSLLMQDAKHYPQCAVLCYGYMLDREGATCVADAAKQWGFANPTAGKSVADLQRDVPLFLARAGRDQMPCLNETLDRCVAQMLSDNLPITLANHSEGQHAFDIVDDTPTSREIIKRILSFLQFHLVT